LLWRRLGKGPIFIGKEPRKCGLWRIPPRQRPPAPHNLRLEASWLRLAEESEKIEKIGDSEGDSPT